MKNNVKEILMYAVLALGVLILISFLAGFIAWVWTKLIIGFVAAGIILLVQKIQKKETGSLFIVWWGISITALLVAMDLLTMFIMRYIWLIFVALIIGLIIWAVLALRKKK